MTGLVGATGKFDHNAVPRTGDDLDHSLSRDGLIGPYGTAEASVSRPIVTSSDECSQANVDERVRDHVELVGALVTERMRTVPAHVNRDDLTSAGMMALVLSARAFRPDRGVPFPAFASFRIRGALIDELRAMDWVSRSVRHRARDVETVRAELIVTLDRSPRTDDIADAMGITTREVTTVYADLARGTVLSLQAFADDSVPVVLSGRTNCPESMLLQREQMGYLHDAIAVLPERLRFVVVAYYFEEREMSHIAIELSVSQSRVSQMCTEATSLMRDGMNAALNPGALLVRTGRAAAARKAYFAALADRNTVAGRLDMSTADGEMREDACCRNGDIPRRARIA